MMTFTTPSENSVKAARHNLTTGGRAFLFTLVILAGCARDPVDEAAWQASRVGTAFGEGHGGRDTTGLDAGARITERFYYVAKYEATKEQRLIAEKAGRLATARLATEARKPRHRPTPRYIAVQTRSDSRAKTRTSVVIWSTESARIVGNTVYDINQPPPLNTVLKFDTYSARYVGTGDGVSSL